MKKIISAVLAVTLCMGAFVSCGDKEKDKNSGGSLSTSGKSKYTLIVPLDGNRDSLMEGIDSGIKYSINSAKAYEKENKGAKCNPWIIEFSGNKFVIPTGKGNDDWSYYNGTFSVKNGIIKFSYENYINVGEKINVNDKSAKAELMQDLNKTGAYWKYTVPLMNYSDKWTDYALLPFIRYIKPVDINTELPNTLKTVNDFLCTDTYGIKLKGSYKNGKDFKLEYNFIDTLKKDEQSPYLYESEPEEWLERMTEFAERYYYCDDLNSTIKFSGGEWEWYNAADELLNNGKYEESKDYSGLIKMYIDEDSEKFPEYAKSFPLWFYIDDDGEIYYPAFVKVE